MIIDNNKLIVVLGMHRSGTSAITRALQVLGINLGDSFLPAKGDNLKGFWEDADINALNIQMLSAIDSDWHHLTPIDAINVESLRKKGYLLRAVDMLRKKVGNTSTFAFKDPRVAKLLPFWKEVFSHCKYNVSYVIAVRHPLSVVKSLAKRNGFDAEKTYLLWLGHVVTSLSGSIGEKRILVDYDKLMQSPDLEIGRIAKCMRLAIDDNALQNYRTEFLDAGLRHTVYELQDLLLEDTCPPIVREVYTDLLDVASDKATLEDEEILNKIIRWSTEFERLKSPLLLVDRLYTQKAVASQGIAERDGQITSLNHTVVERDAQITSLNHTVVERDAQIASINQTMVERDAQIASINQAMVECDAQIASLNQAVLARDGQIVNLNQAVVERDNVIQQFLSSASWRLTLPLRAAKMFLKPNIGALNNTAPTRIRSILIRNIRRAKLLRTILPTALSRSGGFINTVRKAWKVFKREGWGGIKHRIIFLHSQINRPAGAIIALNRNNLLDDSRRDGMLTDETRATMVKRIDNLKFQPLISVVVPTFNPKPEWLKKAIESVRKQVYPYWELCIADDASTDESIRPILQHYSAQDNRIKIVLCEKNGGISAASNSALAIATGEYIALLDHDDELSADALYWIAEEICAYPDAEVIYSDEDKIAPDGSLTDVFFKPDWSPELMYNCMYIGHLTVYKALLINQVGGFRSKYDFSQDYDLALRATERAHTVRHIPRILYHWRQAEGSSSQGGKPYARISNLAALQNAIDRRGIDAQVIDLPTANRVKITGWQPKTSIVIPTDSEVNLVACLDAISKKTNYPSWEIIVVTNSKLADRLAQRFSSLPLSFCRYDKPYNFSDKCNEGANQASGEVVVFFNDDVRPLSDGWLGDLIELLVLLDVGAVAPKLLYEDHRIQYSGMVTGVRGLVGTSFHCLPENTTEYFNFAQSVRDVSVVSGACLAMRRNDFLEVGGFDAINTPIMHSDVDLSFKVREKGLRCVYTPYATLLHIGHQSLREHDKKQTKADQDKSDIYLLKRWGAYVTYDPYFPDNMRGLLYHDSPEPILMWGQNRPELVKSHADILLVTHDMSASGAPMIAYQAAKIFLASGAFPVVASPEDGPMREMFISLGIPVIIDPLLLTRHETVRKLARNFDCVLANTVASWPIVYQLLEEEVPVMWYLHESELIKEIAETHPLAAETLHRARHVYAGSDRAASFCQPFNKTVKILSYGVPDIFSGGGESDDLKAPLVFSVFGTIEPRKGQDIFLEAIRLAAKRTAGRASFNLIGRTLDEEWVIGLKKQAEYLENVFFHGAVDHPQYLNLIGATHVVVCPSRDDTLPLVSLDALCLGKALICTKTTGTANFMTNGKDGLVVPSADPAALAEAIVSLIENTTHLESMGAEGRQTFLRHFAEERFAERLVDEVRGLHRKVQ